MTTAEVLRAAKALIDTPEKWTTGQCFRDENGIGCAREEAVTRCALGAIDTAAPEDWHPGHSALEAITGPVSIFNDQSTHAEVMVAFDRAIALAEAP